MIVHQDRRTSAKRPSRVRETGPYTHLSNSISHTVVDGTLAVEVGTSASRNALRRRSGQFLKGPIPLADIAAAARLPGAALPVYLAIHHRIALTRAAAISLPKSLLRELGVTKDAKARALHQLEAAGLIDVERRRGRPALVSLNPPTEYKEKSNGRKENESGQNREGTQYGASEIRPCRD